MSVTGEELSRMVAMLGGQSASARALESIGYITRADNLKRLIAGKEGRRPSDDLMTAMRHLTSDMSRWCVGRDEKRRKVIVHLNEPAFAAVIAKEDFGEVRWLGDKPSTRQQGDLLNQARAYLAG